MVLSVHSIPTPSQFPARPVVIPWRSPARARLCDDLMLTGVRDTSSSLLDAFLDEFDALHHAEPLRLGLLATALALVDAQLDLVDKAQADSADLWCSRSRLSSVGRWTIAG